MPTGTRIVLGRYTQYIYPSLFDVGQTEGLCGTLNGYHGDDKTIRNSNPMEQDQGRRVGWSGNIQYHRFQESWRYTFE